MDPYFLKKYKLVSSTKTFGASQAVRKVCRFCKRNESQVSFNNLPHAIPELLGKNNYISRDECDDCNSWFSAYESHLSIFFRPYLTMVGVKGKRKIPDFHSRTKNGDEVTRTIIKVGKDGNRKVILSDLSDYIVDKDRKIISLVFRKPPHKPYFVYKALVKIGMSLVPPNYIDRYEQVYKWLLDKDCCVDTFITAFITILTRSKFSEPFAELYLAKRTIYKKHFLPQATLILGFANVVIQIFLPEDSHEPAKEVPPELNLYPSFVLDRNSARMRFVINTVDLKSRDSVTYNETLNFSFELGEFNIPDGQKPDVNISP